MVRSILISCACVLLLTACGEQKTHQPVDAYEAAKKAYGAKDYHAFASFFTRDGQAMLVSRLAVNASLFAGLFGDESELAAVLEKHCKLLPDPPKFEIKLPHPRGGSFATLEELKADEENRKVAGLLAMLEDWSKHLRQHPDPSRCLGDLLAAMVDTGLQPPFAELFREEAQLGRVTIDKDEASASMKFVGTASSSVRFARVSAGWLLAEVTP